MSRTIVNCDHLTWEVIVHSYDDHEARNIEYFHKCITWCHNEGLPIKVKGILGLSACDEYIREFSHDPYVNLEFRYPEHAIQFKLVWGDQT